MKVSDAKLDEVRTRGFTVIENFLEPALLAQAQAALWTVFPKPEEYFADPDGHAKLAKSQFSGIRLFPYPAWALNRLSVHPDLVDAAERFCGTEDLHLYKIELWAKYAGAIDYDQAHHRDFGNHTLVVPKAAGSQQMTTFLLLSDVTELDGPTKVVPLEKTRDLPLWPAELKRGAYEEQEIAVTAPAGSLFIYRTDVLHRGSNFKAPGRARFALLNDFQPRGAPWAGKLAWPNHALSPHWLEAMAAMSPRERQLFGFPAPNDPYWDAQTVRDVGLRYPQMDMRPYREALK